MADDDDAIYVDVKARVDEASADEAESKLKDKFKDVAANIGDSIKDATRNIGDHVKDLGDSFRDSSLRDFGKDIGGTIGDAVKEAVKDRTGLDTLGKDIAKELGQGHIHEALNHVSDTVTNTTDLIQNLGEAFGVHLDGVGSVGKTITGTISDIGDAVDTVTNKVRGVTDTLKAFRSHDVSGGLSGVSGLFGGVDAIDQASATAGAIQEITNQLREFGPAAAAVAGPLGVGASLYGLGAYGVVKGVGTASGMDAIDQQNRQDYAGYRARGGGKLGPDGKPLTFEQYQRAQGYADLYPTAPGVSGAPTLLGSPTAEFDASTPGPVPRQPGPNEVLLPIPGGRFGTRGPQQVVAGDMPAAGAAPVTSGGGGGGVTHAQQAVVEAGSAVVTAGSVSLGGISLPSIISSASGSSTSSMPKPPAGMRYDESWGHGGSVSHPTTLGGLLGRSSGGILPGDSPGHDNMFGSLGGRPIGLEGGEFVVNPQATKDNLSLLKAINASAHFDEGGQVPGGGGQGPKQPQSIGTGKGISVGGGALGMAEQGAAMMAGPLGPAVSIGEQEANLAVQKVGQMGAALAMAPYETFHLGGGQMGAPTAGKGWAGKILGGLVGQQDKLANMAGAVMKPKQPQQPGEGDPHLPGSPSPNQAPGPQGTKDDPIHTKNVSTGPGPPQNGPTSAANMNASALVHAQPA